MSFPEGWSSFKSIQKWLFLRDGSAGRVIQTGQGKERGWDLCKNKAGCAGRVIWDYVRRHRLSRVLLAAALGSDGLLVAECSPRHSRVSTARVWLPLQRNPISCTQKSAQFLHLSTHSEAGAHQNLPSTGQLCLELSRGAEGEQRDLCALCRGRWVGFIF